jgi:hypothetical protein
MVTFKNVIWHYMLKLKYKELGWERLGMVAPDRVREGMVFC